MKKVKEGDEQNNLEKRCKKKEKIRTKDMKKVKGDEQNNLVGRGRLEQILGTIALDQPKPSLAALRIQTHTRHTRTHTHIHTHTHDAHAHTYAVKEHRVGAVVQKYAPR